MIAIGDSHTFVFKDTCPVVHIDNPTAHNIAKHDDLISESLYRTMIHLFSFGEIDCRIHFWYQHKKTNTPLMDLIENTVMRYIHYILNKPKFKIYVLSVPPAGNQGNRFKYPYYASTMNRRYIYYAFNLVLESKCVQYNIPFINYYQDAIDNRMNRKPEFVKDDVHLNKQIVPFILRRVENEKTHKG